MTTISIIWQPGVTEEHDVATGSFSFDSGNLPDAVQIQTSPTSDPHVIHGNHLRAGVLAAGKATFDVKLPGLVPGVRNPWATPGFGAITATTSTIEFELESRLRNNVAGVEWIANASRRKKTILRGRLENFARDDEREIFRVRTEKRFPFDRLAFITKHTGGVARSQRVSVGLFSTQSDLHILVATEFKTRVGTSWETSLGGDERGKARIKQRFDPGHHFPTIHILTLSQNTGSWVHAHNWFHRGALEVLRKNWNQTILRSRDGLWMPRSHSPWFPAPEFAIANPELSQDTSGNNELGVLFLFEPSPLTVTRHAFLIGEKDRSSEVTLEFPWQLPKEQTLSIKGTLNTTAVPKIDDDFSRPILDPTAEDDSKVIEAILGGVERIHAGVDAGQTDIEMRLNGVAALNPALEEKTIRTIGAFNLTAAAPSSEKEPSLRLRWQGELQRANYSFLASELVDLPVRVNHGNGADRDTQFAVFNSAGDIEDALHRSTDSIVAVWPPDTDKDIGDGDADNQDDDSKTPAGILADFTIRAQSDFGAHATVELELHQRDDTATHEPMSFFQAKPFLYAKIRGVEHDPEGGLVFARWRNDDPEGPQWRMAYRSATLELPPQAIGEEMERGTRFWPKGEAYFDESLARYRFSPTTELTVQPDGGRRRFNTVPSNLFRMLDHADVLGFRTEMVYPVAIQYIQNEQSEQTVRVAETRTYLGDTGPNLPLPVAKDQRKQLLNTILEGDLSAWSVHWTEASDPWSTFNAGYQQLRRNHSANKANFAARIARLHLYDPQHKDAGLGLNNGLMFELRSYGAKPGEIRNDTSVVGLTPPLINPLPRNSQHADVDPSERGPIAPFLWENKWADEDVGDDSYKDPGAFRGGVVHTVEFPSELVAILRNPVSADGGIDSLSFSSLGASGGSAARFDEGRTTFTVEVQDGQVARLLKTRIGRIGITWNRAKHIIVYERTVLPSQQFDDQQAEVPHLGWPILRKTEEYIEPIDVTRPFAQEAQSESNKSGFLDAFEFVSSRIYVDSAWGREVGETLSGYEIPLWDGGVSEAEVGKTYTDHGGQQRVELDGGWYYPKPKLAFSSRADDGAISRQWIDDPDELVFYTNTEEGTGNDPDAWDPVRGVDAPNGIFRWGVVTRNPEPSEWDAFLAGRATSRPRRDAMRRRRFELRVTSDAAVDLQKQRSDKPVYAPVELLSVARSGETSGSAAKILQKEAGVKKAFERLQDTANYAGAIGDVTGPIQQFVRTLPERILQFSCGPDLQKGLIEELDRLEADAKSHIQKTLNALPEPPEPPSLAELGEFTDRLQKEIAGVSIISTDVLEVLAKDVREYLDARIFGLSEQEIIDARAEIQTDLNERIRPILERTRRAKRLVETDIVARAKTLTDGAQASVIVELEKALKAVGDALKALDDEATVGNLNRIHNALTDAKSKLVDAKEKLQAAKRPGFRQLAMQVEKLLDGATTIIDGGLKAWDPANKDPKATVDYYKERVRKALQDASSELKKLYAAVPTLAAKLHALVTYLADSLTALLTSIESRIRELEQSLEKLITGTEQELLGELNKIRGHVDATIDGSLSVLASVRELENSLKNQLLSKLNELIGPLSTTYGHALNVYYEANTVYAETADKVENAWLREVHQLRVDAEDIIVRYGANLCEQIEEAKKELIEYLGTAEEELRDAIAGALPELIDEQSIRTLENLAKETEDQLDQLNKEYGETFGKLDTGIKLAKALGDMPALPDLTFNVDRAEYVFDDIKNQIETSPFAARVKEINAGLKDLGINIPSTDILDQVLPKEDVELAFRSVMDSLGGMDFSDLFEKFRLPQIKRDQYQITHGVDKKSRTAWMKAQVNAAYPKRQALFDLGSFGIFMSKMQLSAISEQRINLEGETQSTVDAKFTADWALQFGSVDLATFRKVTVHYDGNSFSFDINPNNVEYHPSLKFISDVAKQLEGELPAGVSLIKDERGMPIGAEAKLVTTIEDPPPLGPVSLGPLTLEGGLGLLLADKGQFLIRAQAGVGSKETPIFVQIGWLGGGAWVTCTARNGPNEQRKRVTEYTASVGVALGSVRAVNIANVARGSYSFLLFANADFSDATGGVLRAGLSVRGSARLMQIATVFVYLLLEATHSSEGGTSGRGVLRAKVKMSRFYTLKVNKGVNKKF